MVVVFIEPRLTHQAVQRIERTRVSSDADVEKKDATVYFSQGAAANQWLMSLDAQKSLKFNLKLTDFRMITALRESALIGLSAKCNVRFRYKDFLNGNEKKISEAKAFECIRYFEEQQESASFVHKGTDFKGKDRYEVVIHTADLDRILIISLEKTGFAEPCSKVCVPILR